MKNLLQMMSEIEPGFLTGACCFLDVLRMKAGMQHNKFNQAVIALADTGKIFLERHAHPAQLSEGEKRNYVTVGENTFIVAVIRKDAVDRMPVIEADHPGRKSSRGGKRPGAGRKAGVSIKPEMLKRKPVCVKLPEWMATWLANRGNVGKTIEAALIEKHKLTPPA